MYLSGRCSKMNYLNKLNQSKGGQDYLLLRHEGTSMGKLHGLFSPGADDDCDDDNDKNDKTSHDDEGKYY